MSHPTTPSAPVETSRPRLAWQPISLAGRKNFPEASNEVAGTQASSCIVGPLIPTPKNQRLSLLAHLHRNDFVSAVSENNFLLMQRSIRIGAIHPEISQQTPLSRCQRTSAVGKDGVPIFSSRGVNLPLVGQRRRIGPLLCRSLGAVAQLRVELVEQVGGGLGDVGAGAEHGLGAGGE
jgi:hypothetical protein